MCRKSNFPRFFSRISHQFIPSFALDQNIEIVRYALHYFPRVIIASARVSAKIPGVFCDGLRELALLSKPDRSSKGSLADGIFGCARGNYQSFNQKFPNLSRPLNLGISLGDNLVIPSS